MLQRLKSFILVTGMIAASACSPSAPKTIVQTPAKNVRTTPTQIVWTIDLPSSWTKTTYPNPTEAHDIRRVLYAEKADESSAFATVIVGRVDKESAVGFAKRIFELELERENVKVLDGRKIALGGEPAVEWIEIRQMDPRTLYAIITVAVSKGDFGVVTACGGGVEIADKLLEECQTIVESLRLDLK